MFRFVVERVGTVDQRKAHIGIGVIGKSRQLGSHLSRAETSERVNHRPSASRSLAIQLLASSPHRPVSAQQLPEDVKDSRAPERLRVFEPDDEEVCDSLIAHGSERMRGRAVHVACGIVRQQHRECAEVSYARRASGGSPYSEVRIGEQRLHRMLRKPCRMLGNLEAHEPVLVLRRRCQHVTRVRHQARQRAHSCDSDMRDPVRQQPSAVSCSIHDGRSRICAIASSAADGGQPAGISLIAERRDRKLNNFAIPDPPQRGGNSATRERSISRSRLRNGAAACWLSNSTSRAIAARATSGLGSSSDSMSSWREHDACTTRIRRWRQPSCHCCLARRATGSSLTTL